MPRKKFPPKKFTLALLWAALICAVIVCGFLLGDYLYHQKHFPKNTYIENASVAGLTTDEAIQNIKNMLPAEAAILPIVLIIGRDKFAFSPEEIGLEIDAKKSVEAAAQNLRGISFFRQWERRAHWKPRVFPFYFKSDTEAITAFLMHFEAIVNRPFQDAKIIFLKGGGYHVKEEKVGRKLYLDESRNALEEVLRNGKREATLKLEFSPARITKVMLKDHPPAQLLSKFTTFYGTHDSPNRIHNIQLIASWIDDTMLLSGESFSLLKHAGDFSEERGFKEAFVILGGELVPQYGGGGCQIGTTLFNAVSLADLNVKKRRNHSFYFNIYPLGRDATIYPDSLDLLFENDSGFPILIKTEATNKYLTFRIYGTPHGRKVEFSPAAVYMLSTHGKFVRSSLRSVIQEDRPFRTEIVRKVLNKEGGEIHSEVIKSYYKLYGERDNVPIRRKEPR